MAGGKTAEKRADQFKRVCDLEYALIKTRDELRVITRGLEGVADRYATADSGEITQDDVSALYGVVALLDHVAGECDRAFWEGAD